MLDICTASVCRCKSRWKDAHLERDEEEGERIHRRQRMQKKARRFASENEGNLRLSLLKKPRGDDVMYSSCLCSVPDLCLICSRTRQLGVVQQAQDSTF